MWNYNNDVLVCGGYGIPTSGPYLIYTDCRISKEENNFASWDFFPNLLNPMWYSRTLILNGQPWVAGGGETSDHNYGYTKKTMYYDGTNWQLGPEIPKVLGHFAFVPISDTAALIIGGNTVIAGPNYEISDMVYVLETGTNPPTMSTYDTKLPLPLKQITGVKFTKNNVESVITIGFTSAGNVYRSDLPNGAWIDDPAMRLTSFVMNDARCFHFTHGDIWCAFTKVLTTSPTESVHKFNPDGPPYWSQLPITLTATSFKEHMVMYGPEKSICC